MKLLAHIQPTCSLSWVSSASLSPEAPLCHFTPQGESEGSSPILLWEHCHQEGQEGVELVLCSGVLLL
jgi:hypothetical protein